jgi:hypothetical protein
VSIVGYNENLQNSKYGSIIYLIKGRRNNVLTNYKQGDIHEKINPEFYSRSNQFRC